MLAGLPPTEQKHVHMLKRNLPVCNILLCLHCSPFMDQVQYDQRIKQEGKLQHCHQFRSQGGNPSSTFLQYSCQGELMHQIMLTLDGFTVQYKVTMSTVSSDKSGMSWVMASRRKMWMNEQTVKRFFSEAGHGSGMRHWGATNTTLMMTLSLHLWKCDMAQSLAFHSDQERHSGPYTGQKWNSPTINWKLITTTGCTKKNSDLFKNKLREFASFYTYKTIIQRL